MTVIKKNKRIALKLIFLASIITIFGCNEKELQNQATVNYSKFENTNSRIDNLDIILHGLIKDERDARVQADESLNKRIDNILTTIDGYQSETRINISNLNTQNNDLRKTINETHSDLNKKILDSQIAASNMEYNLNLKILTTDTNLREALFQNTDRLQNQISRNMENLLTTSGQTAQNKQTIIEQGQKLLDLTQNHQEFKNLVATTYTTKAELNSVMNLYTELSNFTKYLDLKIDRSKEEIQRVLGSDISLLNNRLAIIENKVSNQERGLTEVTNDLSSAIWEYRNSIRTLGTQLRQDISNTEGSLGTLLNTSNNNLRTEVFNSLNRQSLTLTLYTQSAVTDISNSIIGLESRISQLSTSESNGKNILTTKINELKQQMSDALASEQEARNQISSNVEKLTNRMKIVEEDLVLTKSMANQNASMISRISIDFEQEKTNTANRFSVQKSEVDQKLQLLNDTFSKNLQEVANRSEQLVANLGADVQTNFKSITSDIAVLTAKQANTDHDLRNFIEELQTDKAKTVQFEKSMYAPRKEIQVHISNAIDNLSELQLRFIKLLAPDQDKKDFYDETLKPIALTCQGSVETSFTTALGMDSFQILSVEYIRLLLNGLRGGDEVRDLIFYGYGAAEDNTSFARAIALGLTKNSLGSETPECLSKVQDWARSIILNDPRFEALASKISNDDEFERRIDVLYAAIEKMKPSALTIENLLKKSVVGVNDQANVYNTVVVQTVNDLINGAWEQRQLNDRLVMLDNFEEIQTKQTNMDTEMKAGFSELKGLLASFTAQGTARLNKLEQEQGAMKTSLKRALDVLISLSDRAGYPDLKAYTLWAGQPIQYVPVVFPNWKPEVTLIQHFFSGPKSLMNKTDTCTGATIIATGGIGSSYKLGGWGPCWVNFRNLPSTAWASEASSLMVRVFGAGQLVRIKVDPAKQKERSALFTNYNFNKVYDFSNLTSLNPALKFSGDFSKAVYDIKMPDLMAYYVNNIRTWGGLTFTVQTSRTDNIGDQSVVSNSATLDYTIQLFSPLILDFHMKSLPQTINPNNSRVVTDLKGDGKKRRSGWVSGNESAFLVRDIIVGEKISGTNLFGEGVKIGHKAAKDGFEALGYFDSNKDTFINKKDIIWSSLNLFFDYNSNGVVDSGELKSLSECGVYQLNLIHKNIDPAKGILNGNDIRFESEALDSKGNMIAKSYDVFFGVN